MHANVYALGAIALWATLATLGVALRHVPPFLLTGLALLIGSVPSWPLLRQWRVPPSTLALGIGGLFGYHLLLLIVLLAPVLLPGMRLRASHAVAALAGFAGAAIAILGSGPAVGGGWYWGYLPALASAFIWAGYSLLTRRVRAFPTAAIGLFGLVSGLLSLACHWALEPATQLQGADWGLIVAMGLGPLGAAFFLWDRALKLGDPRQIGILSYLTPLASTLLLMAITGRALSWSIALAALLIIGAAVAGTWRPGAKAPATP
jgi:drug/metabolite transporter (DMT)-like permease